MKNILLASISMFIGLNASAQVGSSSPASAVYLSTAGVNNYKSFLAYVAKEKAGLKIKEVTVENGQVKDVLKKMGIVISSHSRYGQTKDYFKTAYESPDKKSVALLDQKLKHIEMYNAAGELLGTVPYSKFIDGVLVFSESRLFAVRGCFGWKYGFEIYDFSGKLVRDINEESNLCGEDFVVSNTQKYFAFLAMSRSPVAEYFVLYDMDGNEVWRKKRIMGGQAEIQFSLDDKFVIVKLPSYWEENKSAAPTNPHEKVLKKNKVYVLDIENKKLLSEENYTD